ncbi:MAG: FmdE family protein [Thermodesulforhabdaceae bacterium]
MIKWKTVVFISVFILAACGFYPTGSVQQASADSNYDNWAILGYKASSIAQRALGKSYGLIVLTDAGYVEVNGLSTIGVVDGITRSLPVGIGDKTLVLVHRDVFKPLWFAFYDPASGKCAYLELISDAVKGKTDFSRLPPSVFRGPVVERIDAQYLISHASEFDRMASQKVFGGNEFSIVTIANAAALGVPDYVMNSVTFHDHYCPGVTSGILMANWAKKNFPPLPGGSYFVQSVDPWCKEDALQIMLNTTPGKKGYAVTYPTSDDKAKWRADVKNASTILYRQNPSTQQWEGVVLGFTFATSNTGCESITSATVQRLCLDLWYLNYLETPERFVSKLYEFTLPTGTTPQALARPGVDPMKELGLTTQ